MKSLSRSLSACLSVIVITVTGFGAGCSSAEERVAFIVGNDSYPSVPLKNAVGDATAVRDMLRDQMGFKSEGIFFAKNTDRLVFYETFEKFTRAAGEAELVLVYYAGHGMESLDGKENFILPVDADVNLAAQSEAALRAAGINLMTLCSELAQKTNGAKVVLVDACRQRPAARGAPVGSGGGLAIYEDRRIPADTLIMLAAAPDRAASDGSDHGPFTAALLEVLPKEEQDLMSAFFSVSDRVQELTEKRQIPWLKFDGSGKIFRSEQCLTIGKGEMYPVKSLTGPSRKPGSAISGKTGALAKSTMGRMISTTKLHRLSGRQFVPMQLEKVPDYYILYFTASW